MDQSAKAAGTGIETGSSVVAESSILKSGFILGRGLGRKLYLPTFLGLYPTTIGGISGVWGGALYRRWSQNIWVITDVQVK